MTDPLPPPLISAEVDINGCDYMPLLGERLLNSEFDAMCSDSEWRAGLTLWWKAWRQHPPGSLPDNDASLARIANLGRDHKALKRWLKLRTHALHGFVKCSDGRLYHPVICELAQNAWNARLAVRERKRASRERKEAELTGHSDVTSGHRDGTSGHMNGTVTSRPVTRQGKGKGKVEGKVTGSEPNGSGAGAPELAFEPVNGGLDPARVLFGEGLAYLTGHGLSEPNARSLLGKWRKRVGDPAVIDALHRANASAVSDPVPWIEALLKAPAPIDAETIRRNRLGGAP